MAFPGLHRPPRQEAEIEGQLQEQGRLENPMTMPIVYDSRGLDSVGRPAGCRHAIPARQCTKPARRAVRGRKRWGTCAAAMHLGGGRPSACLLAR